MYTIYLETVLDENYLTKNEVINDLISDDITYLDKNIKTNYEKKYKNLAKNTQLLSISLNVKNYDTVKKILNHLKEFNKKHPKSIFYIHKIIRPNKKEKIINNII